MITELQLHPFLEQGFTQEEALILISDHKFLQIDTEMAGILLGLQRLGATTKQAVKIYQNYTGNINNLLKNVEEKLVLFGKFHVENHTFFSLIYNGWIVSMSIKFCQDRLSELKKLYPQQWSLSASELANLLSYSRTHNHFGIEYQYPASINELALYYSRLTGRKYKESKVERRVIPRIS
jgi:hypothetical protein